MSGKGICPPSFSFFVGVFSSLKLILFFLICRYNVVRSLAREFGDIDFILNGGISSLDHAEAILAGGGDVENTCPDIIVSEKTKKSIYLGSEERWSGGGEGVLGGVMIGRHAYKNLTAFWDADTRFFGDRERAVTVGSVVEDYVDYCGEMQER